MFMIIIAYVRPIIAFAKDSTIIDYYKSGVEMMKSQGKYIDALTNLLIFINYTENEGDKYEKELMAAYCYVGTIYGFYEDYMKAKDYFYKGFDISVKINDNQFRQAFLNNLVSCLIQLRSYDEAGKYADMMLTLSGRSNNVLFEYLIAKGSLAKARRDLTDASKVYAELLSIVGKDSFTNYQKANLMYEIAEYHELNNQIDSQEYYLLRGYDLALKQNFHKPIIDFSISLARMYAKKRAYGKSVEWQNKYFELQDSLMTPEDFVVARSTHEIKSHNFNLSKIDSLNSVVRLQHILICFFIITVVLTGTMLVIIYRQKRKINLAYKTLIEKDQKDILLSKSTGSDMTKENDESVNSQDSSAGEDTPSLSLFNEIVNIMNNGELYLNPEFSLAQLTSLVKSNMIYVSKTINHFTGDNVKSFINEYRIKEAKHRLVDVDNFGNMTVNAIAESVGFRSQTSFNRSFKKFAGMTPSAYIKMMRQLPDQAKMHNSVD